jgi:PAS domain S-box-containing protein
MKDQSKTKQELLKENSLLKQRIQKLEESESKHKRIEEALLQSEEKFSKAFQTSPCVITISYPESGKFIEVNNTFISVTGFSREEALADSSFGLKLWVNEDDRQRVVADLKAGRAVVDQEFKFRTNSGDVMTGLLSAQTIQLSHGPCIFSSIIDITERKEVNRKLQEAVIFQHYLIDALPMPIFYKDSEGRYLGCNSFFEKFFGQKKEQVIGKSVYELSPKEFADIYHEKDLALLQNPGIQIYESTVKDRGGVVHSVIFHKATFSNMDGSVGGLIGAILDITDRKRAEVQLHASLREKDILLREIHHRVKNNMQVIIGLLDLQASSSGNPELMEMLNKGQSRIRSMALVHEKLYASKDFTRINLAGYLRTLSRDLFQSYKINPGKIDLIIQTDGVYVDINKAIPCGLVLNELISNVLKHAFPGDRQGELQIIIREEKNTEMEIVVRDNGMGLPDDVDMHQPRTMGLNLVNGLVKNQLDGQMEVRRDNGTEFRIKFPL